MKNAKQSCILFKYKTFDSRFTERKLNIIIFFYIYCFIFLVQVADYNWCHWIGLTDLNSEGVWLWNSSRTGNGLWDSFHIYNKTTHINYDCVIIYSNTWYNHPCDHAHYFICEKQKTTRNLYQGLYQSNFSLTPYSEYVPTEYDLFEFEVMKGFDDPLR